MIKKKKGEYSGFETTNILAIVLLVVLAGFVGHFTGKYAQNHSTNNEVTQEIAGAQTVTYNGVDGKNALDLLKEKAQIKTEDSSVGVFVTEINNVPNSEDHFWMFYVNGEWGPVAADQYQTKTDDKIEWRYEKFQ